MWYDGWVMGGLSGAGAGAAANTLLTLGFMCPECFKMEKKKMKKKRMKKKRMKKKRMKKKGMKKSKLDNLWEQEWYLQCMTTMC